MAHATIDFSANASDTAHSCRRFAASGESGVMLERSAGEKIGRAGLTTWPNAVDVEHIGRFTTGVDTSESGLRLEVLVWVPL